MSKNGFKLPRRDSWQMRMVRVTVTIVIVIGVVYLQNLLVTLFPLPVDVQKSTPPVTPLTAALIRKEELIVDHPSKKTTENSATDIPPEVLFQDDRKDDVTIDAHFASARLG